MLKELCAITVKTYFCVLQETQQGKYDTKYNHLHFIITAVHVKEMWPHIAHMNSSMLI